MTTLILKVSRESNIQLFKIRQRIKHGKGKLASKTNSLLLAHHRAIPIKVGVNEHNKPMFSTLQTFIDKKAGLCEQYEQYENMPSYKAKFKIGLQRIKTKVLDKNGNTIIGSDGKELETIGKLEFAPKKRLTYPKELLFAKTELKFDEVNNALIQKIVKQWLTMHGAEIPANDLHFRELVNKRHESRKVSEGKVKDYQNYLIYKGVFNVHFAEGELPYSVTSLKIRGLDSKGNLVVDSGLLAHLRTFLTKQVTTLI